MENQDISNDVHNIIKIFSVEVIELSRKAFQLFNHVNDNNFLPKADIHCFSDLIHVASSGLLNTWLECGEIGDVVGSIFEALLLCAKRNWIEKEIFDFLLMWNFAEQKGAWIIFEDDFLNILKDAGFTDFPDKLQGAARFEALIAENEALRKFLFKYISENLLNFDDGISDSE